MGRIRTNFATAFDVPLLRRVFWHVQRIRGGLDRRFFFSLFAGILVVVAVAAILITLIEKPWTLESFGDSFYWGLTTIFGQGDSAFVKSPAGWIISWLLILFGVAMLGTITGALVAAVIDFLLKEGQGMGASGYHDHIVICGWNATARDLVKELKGDDYHHRLVLIHDVERNPAGEGVYFVRGDAGSAADLDRAGIKEAAAAIVFPSDGSNEADFRDILVVMAIESIAPQVRTVVEVNNAQHLEHFERAKADEILVTPTLASHLLARSALYPGLASIVTDIVSGGKGSELYRVELPEEYVGLSINDLSARLRLEHSATLLSIGRGVDLMTNPPAEFRVAAGDHAVVVAESLGTLAPLKVPPTAALEVAAATVPPEATPGAAAAVPLAGTAPVEASAPVAANGAKNGAVPAAKNGAKKKAKRAAHA
jgi:voltage-gated potassium channel